MCLEVTCRCRWMFRFEKIKERLEAPTTKLCSGVRKQLLGYFVLNIPLVHKH